MLIPNKDPKFTSRKAIALVIIYAVFVAVMLA